MARRSLLFLTAMAIAPLCEMLRRTFAAARGWREFAPSSLLDSPAAANARALSNSSVFRSAQFGNAGEGVAGLQTEPVAPPSAFGWLSVLRPLVATLMPSAESAPPVRLAYPCQRCCDRVGRDSDRSAIRPPMLNAGRRCLPSSVNRRHNHGIRRNLDSPDHPSRARSG